MEDEDHKPVELDPLPDSRPTLGYVLFAVVIAVIAQALALILGSWLLGL